MGNGIYHDVCNRTYNKKYTNKNKPISTKVIIKDLKVIE